MTIYRPANYIEEYRLRALSADLNQLTGRLRPSLTDFITDRIISRLHFKSDDVVIDIGCGNALCLQKVANHGVDKARGKLVGIVPTNEEAERLRRHLATVNKGFISIEVGRLCETSIPDEFADIVISNGTFLLLENQQAATDALAEITRITKPQGVVFIGELPDKDEMAERPYGNSIFAWLFWLLKNRGTRSFVAGAQQTLNALFTKEPFIISTKKIFFCPPKHFKPMLEINGLKVLDCYKHDEIDEEGNVRESETRWNFIASKEAR
jgi:ubiquinone/menaquinone biosynthesis C-methylase UbiE